MVSVPVRFDPISFDPIRSISGWELHVGDHTVGTDIHDPLDPESSFVHCTSLRNLVCSYISP